MGLMDFIKKQFIDVLQWTEEGDGTLAWRYPMADMEIQNGATLVVRESQMALFVNEGRIADLFGPGTYRLGTQTLPLLTNLQNWDKLFESPFKSDVYFFSTREQLDQKWGTPQPITSTAFMSKLLGLVGESGEVADKFKKIYRDNDGVMSKEQLSDMQKELGDVLWYINAICCYLGLNLEEVASGNLDKLLDRKRRNKIHGSGDNR